MTTKTRQELIYETLDQLNVLVPGQAPSSSNLNKVDGILDPVMEELGDLGIFYVGDAGEIGPTGGEIESSAFLSIAAYLANAAASKFNLPNDTKLKALAMEAEQKLRTLSRPTATRKYLGVDAGIPIGRTRWNWNLG